MIELDRLTRRYGASTVVDDVSLTIPSGTFCALIGASGSGKSTTLRMINRLVEPSGGAVRFDGQDVAALPVEQLRRRMGYVIQSGGLFPHWSVARNIATVPRLLGWDKARVAARVAELMALLRLDAAMAERFPHQLSGGQQQRVGVARALAADPDVLLMDEPFGALDPLTRVALQDELVRIHGETGKTIVLVTHDMPEALRMAGLVAVLRQGRLVQAGTPLELLSNPADDFIRAFVGQEEAGLRLLALRTAGERARAEGDAAASDAIPETMSLRQALSEMIRRDVDRLPVVDASGLPAGVLHLADTVRP